MFAGPIKECGQLGGQFLQAGDFADVLFERGDPGGLHFDRALLAWHFV